MAALLVPGVEHRLLAGKSTTPLDPRWITVHTAVGTLAGTESWFTPAGRPYSHFGVGGDGTIRQWQDLRYRAASDRNGNPYSISIECEDHGALFPTWSGSNVPMFTAKQADALEVLLSWLCHRFGLPKLAIGSSCPHERGIGWHRLGIDPWRQPGCLSFSSAYAKSCPGDLRIAQLRDEIIPHVSAPPPPVTPEEITDMPHPVIRCTGDGTSDTSPVTDAPRTRWLALVPGGSVHVPDQDHYQAGVAAGLLAEVKVVNARQYDVAVAMARYLGNPEG